MDKNIRIDEIVTRLNAASDAYYGGQEEQMTNYEWDALFDELTALEKATGYVRPDSPTQVTSHSGNEMDGEGEKEAHEYPALSLAKTKKVEELQDWAGERDIWLSWKLDGSTLVATYDGGALTRVLTRGNGTIGTNITYMASAIRGIPAKISDKGHLVVARRPSPTQISRPSTTRSRTRTTATQTPATSPPARWRSTRRISTR